MRFWKMLHVKQGEALSIFLTEANTLLKACAKLHEKYLPKVTDITEAFADT